MHRREKDTKGYTFLTNLCPTRGVALCHWLVGVISSMNNGRTHLSKSWS
jgi:hypothetical protein